MTFRTQLLPLSIYIAIIVLIACAAYVADVSVAQSNRAGPDIGQCITGSPSSTILGVSTPPSYTYTLIVPSSMVEGGACVLASWGIEIEYVVFGPYAYILAPGGSNYITIVHYNGCKAGDPDDVLLAYMGYGAHSEYDEAPEPGLTGIVYVGEPLVIDDEYVTITFTPPGKRSAAGLELEFTRSVDSDTGATIMMRFIPVSRPLKGSYSMLVYLCGSQVLNVTVYESSGTISMMVEAGGTTLYSGGVTEQRVVIEASGSIARIELGSLVASVSLSCGSLRSLDVYLVSNGYTDTGDVSFKLKLVVTEGLAITEYRMEAGASVGLAGPSRLQLGQSYDYSVSIAGASATIYLYSPGVGVLGEAQVSDGSSSTITVKATSDLVKSGCIIAVAVNDTGAVTGVAGMRVYILPSQLEKESWVVTLTIPPDEGGYIIYSDGEYDKLPGQPFTLALAGDGYAGCTITLEVDGNTMYEQQIESTAIDVYIPFNFSTPAKVTVMKTVTASGCSVTVSVTRLQYYEIIVHPAAPIVTPRPPTHHYMPPSVISPFIGSVPREAMIIVAAGVAALTLMMMRRGNTLSTSLIYAALALLMLSFIIGGDIAYPTLVTLAVLLLGLGIGIKLKMG